MLGSNSGVSQVTDYLCPGSNEDATNGCADGGIAFTKSRQPRLDAMPENIIFPLTYVFIANIFISQLVIGVLIDNIRRQSGSVPVSARPACYACALGVLIDNIRRPSGSALCSTPPGAHAPARLECTCIARLERVQVGPLHRGAAHLA